jgi:hypothetical protein
MAQGILFRLTSTHLIVVNSRKVFSKEGLKSFGYTDTSAKTSKQRTVPNSEQEAKYWISKIVEKKCDTFKNDLNELDSAGGTEQRTATDYTERLLLELLQNAVDAGAETQIGNKGIGFRSVLNGSKITEVHSGHFHVRWSDEDAKEQLKLRKIETTDKRIPVLAFPTWCGMDDEIRTLMGGAYDTVIKLFLTRKGRQNIIDEWGKFSRDPSLLLFVNNDIDLRWERDGYPKIHWSRCQAGEIVRVEVNEEGSCPKMKCWRRFDSKGATAAYNVDENLQFQESREKNPLLYSFFPAALSSHPFPNLYLHHSKFELQSNRQAIKIDELRLNDLVEVIVLATSSMENETNILDLLRLTPSISTETEIKIWENVRPKLVEKKLKGLRDRRLIDIKSCPMNEDMPYSMRDEHRWKIWEAFLSALKVTRPNSLFDLPVLQPGTENKQREETLLKFNTDSPFCKEGIRELSWAPVESSNHTVDSLKVKIFLPCKGGTLHSPEDIEVRFLTSNFLEDFRNKDANAISFLKEVLGVHEFSAIGVIEHCVLPALEKAQKQEASKELILFLKSLREADPKEAKTSVETFDWENSIRCNLARTLYLSCQEKLWPVLLVYAGQRWTGSKFLEHTYGETRGFIEMKPPEDERERATWERFWKWLGVGWCPKVMPLLDDVVCKSEDHKGLKWNKWGKIFQGTFFQRNDIPDNWHIYCKALFKKGSSKIDSLLKRKPRIKKNWTIDGGLQLLKTPGAFLIIASNWPVYENWMDTMISYSSNKQQDYDNQQTYKNHDFPSYLLWLIQTISWVPCIDGSYYEGHKVFLKNSQVAKKLPQFVTVLKMPEGNERQEKYSLPKEFLKKCGIRSGWKEVKDSDWKSWLKKASEMKANEEESRINREAIRLLYRSLIDHRKIDEGNQWKKQPVKPIKNIPLWGIENPGNIDENWHLCNPTSPPYFVDRGDLADMGLPGLYLFPVRLDGLLKKASTHFGLSPLSDALEGNPLYDGDLCPKYTLKAKERINELVAYLRMDNKKYSDEELIKQISSLKVKQVYGLKVKFSIHGSDLGYPVSQAKFRQKNKDNSWTIFFDESSCSYAQRWEVFAETLLLSCGFDMDKESNVRDLLQYSSSELHGRMLRLGVAPETIEDLKSKKKIFKPLEKIQIPPLQEEPDEIPYPIDKPVIQIVPPPIIEAPPDLPGNSKEIIFDSPKTPPGGKDAPPKRPHPKKGMEAQHWLFNEVKKWCQANGLPDPLEEQHREDITIPLTPPIIIEVKRIKGKTVFWSQNQIKKAFLYKKRGYPQKYTIALVDPNGGLNEIYWVINPLVQFQSISARKIQWRWIVETGKNYDLGSWEQPEAPPKKKSDRYSAIIPLDMGWIKKLPHGIRQGLDLIVNE